MGIETLGSVLLAVAALIAGVFGYAKVHARSVEKEKERLRQENADFLDKLEHRAKQAAQAHNEAVDNANTNREKIDAEADALRAGVLADGDGLRNSAAAINTSIDRANGRL